jgi:hypothetical protein
MSERMEIPESFEAELKSALFAPTEADFLRSLRRQLSAAESVRKNARRAPSWKFAFALGAAVVILAVVLIAGPERVLATMRSLLGYIPGIGFVQPEGGLRTIAAPVVLIREGVTLTVEQAVFDMERSVLVYSVEGIPWSARPAGEASAECFDELVLRKADGTALELTGFEMRGWGSGYRARSVFAAVPSADDRVTLSVPCLLGTKPGGAPENWNLTLLLVPASVTTLVVPVLEVPTATLAPTVLATKGMLDGIRLQAERVVALDQGYRVEGAVLFDPAITFLYQLDDTNLLLSDAAGRTVPFSSVQPDSPAGSDLGRQAWALEIPAGAYASPLTLEMTSVVLTESAQLEFFVDLGEHPADGEVFPLEMKLDVNGHSLILHSLTFNGELGSAGDYTLVFEIPQDVIAVGVNTPEHPSNRGGGGGGPGAQLGLSIGYDDLQAGRQRFVIDTLVVRRPGSWKTTFALPASQGASLTTPSQLGACLTDESWSVLTTNPAPLPAGVQGTLLVEGPAPAGIHFPSLFVIHPDGTGRRDLPAGGWANLGYDGSRMAYSDADGLHLFDLAGSTGALLTTAGKEAYHPLLSPDGASVAYMNTSGDPGLYILPLDGSAPRKIPGTDAWVIPAGWMPDGRRLVVTRLSGDGSRVEILDTLTGAVEKTFAIQNAKGGFPVLSPAGDRLAFSELAFGQSNYSVAAAALDGSDRRSIAALGVGLNVNAGAWSPDGIWLVVVVSTYLDPVTPTQISVLVRPDTCELAVLPFQGAVKGWAT